ncbi:MAG: ABC transporter permease [Actinobacteria bacterium]|nr:ABC transporter permease [Actinomycetota bacterium]
MRARLLLSEALRSVGANVSTTIAATMTVLIAMFLVGLLIAFGTWARSWSDQQKGELLVKVFFCTESSEQKACPEGEASQAQINTVRAKLESMPELVKSITFVSKNEALDRMRKRTPELVQALPANPLPASEEVEPVRGELVDEIDKALHPLPAGVEKTSYAKKTASRVLQVARVIETVFAIAILMLLFASTLLIANTIRLSIFARRREIEVMKLVGASNWFIRGPFMLEGLICGIVGSLAAILLLIVGKEVALPEILGRLDAADGVSAIPFALNALILLGIGLVLGAAGSGLTMRRFLRV